MAWNFDTSLLVFLAAIFFSWSLATKIKSFIPMPLIMGIIFIAAFATNILPKDMVVKSNMIAVGTIAFSVLVIHSGSMINIGLIFGRPKDALLCVISSLLLIPFVGLALAPFISRELSLLASASIVGGGAACAIASRWVLDLFPNISVFPWLIFMFQGLFCVPIVTYAANKEAKALIEDFRAGRVQMRKPFTPPVDKSLVGRIPVKYKNTAYYLGIIMLVWVLNKWLHATLLAPFNININATALIFGFLLGQIGLMDKGPLNKSDSFGLLLLGLMGLMANTLANNSLDNILRLLPPLIISFIVSTLVLMACGVIGAKIFHYRPWRGIALTMNSMMGFPVNDIIIEGTLKYGADENEKNFLRSNFGPLLAMGTMLVSNALSIFVVSIVVSIL